MLCTLLGLSVPHRRFTRLANYPAEKVAFLSHSTYLTTIRGVQEVAFSRAFCKVWDAGRGKNFRRPYDTRKIDCQRRWNRFFLTRGTIKLLSLPSLANSEFRRAFVLPKSGYKLNQFQNFAFSNFLCLASPNPNQHICVDLRERESF